MSVGAYVTGVDGRSLTDLALNAEISVIGVGYARVMIDSISTDQSDGRRSGGLRRADHQRDSLVEHLIPGVSGCRLSQARALRRGQHKRGIEGLVRVRR
jgi:hypothetical protein